MGALPVLEQAAADGVELSVTPSGALKARGPQDAVKRWLPTLRAHKPELLAALMPAANDEPQYRWRLTLPDGAQLKVCAVPELTLSDMQLRYPATIIEPAPSIPRRQPTAEESAELAALIAVVYGNDTEEERAEALTLALADPSSALICYRFIARERAAVVRGQVENRTGQVENRTEHDQNC